MRWTAGGKTEWRTAECPHLHIIQGSAHTSEVKGALQLFIIALPQSWGQIFKRNPSSRGQDILIALVPSMGKDPKTLGPTFPIICAFHLQPPCLVIAPLF